MLFNIGVELSMTPIGERMGTMMTKSKNLILIILILVLIAILGIVLLIGLVLTLILIVLHKDFLQFYSYGYPRK